MKNLPRRKTIRLATYDYSQSGYYFVTVCTRDRQPIFWKPGIRPPVWPDAHPPVGADDPVRPQTDDSVRPQNHPPVGADDSVRPSTDDPTRPDKCTPVGADDPVRPQTDDPVRPQTELTELIKDGTPPEILSTIGKIVKQCWEEINTIYPNVRTDYYVIMPDHFHGIIVIDNSIRPPHVCPDKNTPVRPSTDAPARSPLPKIIQGFKSVTTRRCFQYGYRKIWQRGYFEHIIRNQEDYINTAEYILNNPPKLMINPHHKEI